MEQTAVTEKKKKKLKNQEETINYKDKKRILNFFFIRNSQEIMNTTY